MRCGMTLFIQGYEDWDRYLARERGEQVPDLDPELDRQRLSGEIETALMAEGLGFDSLWTVEHHISPYTMIPNPVQLLTFFAGATSKMDMGTMVVVLPWHHPLRVAEDITLLQYALRGRTPYIGFGRGAARREFRQLGFDMNQSKDVFAESIEIIKAAITQELFSFHGEHFDFENTSMRPRPLDPAGARRRLPLLVGQPLVGARRRRLRAQAADHPAAAVGPVPRRDRRVRPGRAAAGFEPARPRIHMCVYVGENEQEAYDGAHRYIPEYSTSALNNYELNSDHFATTKGYEHYAGMANLVSSQAMGASYLANHVWGTPDVCVERLQAIAEAFHPEEFMLVFRYGSMPRDVAEKSIGLFAREVLPAVHDIELQAPITYDEVAAG